MGYDRARWIYDRWMAVLLQKKMWEELPALRVLATPKRLRAKVGEVVVVDSVDAALVWEPRRVVAEYAVPEADVGAELVAFDAEPVDLDALPPFLGPGRFGLHTTDGEPLSLRVGEDVLQGVAFRPSDPDLGGRIVLDFEAFDWVEEEQAVIGHPRDPFHRIDVLPTSRHITVERDGTVLADTTHAMMLLETNFPPRWYLPTEDVRTDLLVPSDAHTTCAYKGVASYQSLSDAGTEVADIVWSYPEPFLDATHVRDLLCFYPDKVDLSVDGQVDRRGHPA